MLIACVVVLTSVVDACTRCSEVKVWSEALCDVTLCASNLACSGQRGIDKVDRGYGIGD